MDIIDVILNASCLLLWLNASVRGWQLSGPQTAKSLLRTLHRTESPTSRRWTSFLGLSILLVVRSFLYWQLGGVVYWTPTLDFGAVSIPFRSEILGRMFLYSWLSFAKLLILLYSGALILVTLNRFVGVEDDVHRFLRHQLGWIGRRGTLGGLSALALTALILALTAVIPMSSAGLIPHWSSISQCYWTGGVYLMGILLEIKWMFTVILLLGILNSYVYVGNYSLLRYSEISSRQLLKPLSMLPLRSGKLDLTPFVGLALYWVIFWILERGVSLLHSTLS